MRPAVAVPVTVDPPIACQQGSRSLIDGQEIAADLPHGRAIEFGHAHLEQDLVGPGTWIRLMTVGWCGVGIPVGEESIRRWLAQVLRRVRPVPYPGSP